MFSEVHSTRATEGREQRSLSARAPAHALLPCACVDARWAHALSPARRALGFAASARIGTASRLHTTRVDLLQLLRVPEGPPSKPETTHAPARRQRMRTATTHALPGVEPAVARAGLSIAAQRFQAAGQRPYHLMHLSNACRFPCCTHIPTHSLQETFDRNGAC